MKRLFLSILLLIATNGWAVDYTQDANCIGAWTMDVDESPIQDISVANHDLSLKGAGEPDYTASGYLNGGYVFDGNNDYAYSAFAPPNGAYTQILWVKKSYVGNRAISSFSDAAPGNGTYDRQIAVLGSPYNYSFNVYNSGSYTAYSTTTSDTYENLWVFLCGTIDTVAGNSIWVMGVNENTVAGGTNGYNGYSTPNFNLANSNGVYTVETTDEVAIFSRTLSSTEINDIMDNGLVGGVSFAFKPQVINIVQS